MGDVAAAAAVAHLVVALGPALMVLLIGGTAEFALLTSIFVMAWVILFNQLQDDPQ